MTSVEQQYNTYTKHLTKILSEDLLPHKEFKKYSLKVIHDPLWGSRMFYPWEIALIDTPLCQRLRYIYQLGTAYLTYPSAVHTRFSHSLGVTILAGRLITRLKEKAEILNQDIKITKKDIYTVRIAGLLHDIGHSFFSHASEKVLGPIIAPVIKHCLDRTKPKPHEFLSYLIIRNEHFHKFWEKNISPLFHDKEDVPDLDDVANLIVQVPASDGRRFLTDIINGPYDVDKLEYLFRDAKTSGLEISYDIERYFYKIKLVNHPEGTDEWRLAMEEGGVRAVEQIIFSKMMLFSFVYHHQKVLASDTVVGEMLMELLGTDGDGHIKIEHPLDFLRYTDNDILSSNLDGPNERFNTLRNKLLSRDLPKRCFVMNKECVKDLGIDTNVKTNWDALKKALRGFPEEIKKIKEEILEYVGKAEVTLDDIFMAFPTTPAMSEAASGPVIDSHEKLHPMDEYFDLSGWRTTYDLKKLRGYFYSTEKYRKEVSEGVEKYLEDKYKLRFADAAKLEAKIF